MVIAEDGIKDILKLREHFGKARYIIFPNKQLLFENMVTPTHFLGYFYADPICDDYFLIQARLYNKKADKHISTTSHVCRLTDTCELHWISDTARISTEEISLESDLPSNVTDILLENYPNVKLLPPYNVKITRRVSPINI